MISTIVVGVLLLFGSSSSQANAIAPNVRVRVFSNTALVSVAFESIGSDSLRISEAGDEIAVLGPGEPAVVEQWQGILRVKWERGSAPLASCNIGGATLIRVTPDGRMGRLYRGVFEASLDPSDPGRLALINVVDIEEYVASVLPAEYPFQEIEGAKAQAIVIRTYALAAAARSGPDHSLRDDAGSQVYLGVETETDLSRRVARETAGSQLLYKGELIDAVYSSHCGGHTANNEDVWGTTPLPYLRGRKDPYDDDAPVAEWSTTARVKRVHEALSTQLGKKVDGFSIEDRGKGRHVRTVKIKLDDAPDETVSGSRFRSLVNGATGLDLVKSTSFDVKKHRGDYRFSGRGNGHGVGFCQWGAATQAKEGRDYEQILRFYYRDIDITEPEPEALAAFERDEVVPLLNGPERSKNASTKTQDPAARKSSSKKRRPGW